MARTDFAAQHRIKPRLENQRFALGEPGERDFIAPDRCDPMPHPRKASRQHGGLMPESGDAESPGMRGGFG